ncbi:MAG: HIT domain-containing protein [Ignavibacteria bacterium]|nr:HIT domain-containing protein [Ignavibacteria bacterium]
MEKMWSPWRSKYIESFNKKDKDCGCVFCRAAIEDETLDSSLVVHRGKHSFIMLNLYPYNGGHLMIIPDRHLSDFKQVTQEEYTEMMEELQLTIKVFENLMNPQGFNVGMNLGKAAGAGIDQHIHLHVVPRWNGDTNFMPVIGEVKVISQDLLGMKKQLHNEFKIISEMNSKL